MSQLKIGEIEQEEKYTGYTISYLLIHVRQPILTEVIPEIYSWNLRNSMHREGQDIHQQIDFFNLQKSNTIEGHPI